MEFLNVLTRFLGKASKRQPEPEKRKKFYSLAAKSDAQYCEPYLDALNFVISNETICNAGIVGPYASGKTTLVKSYE